MKYEFIRKSVHTFSIIIPLSYRYIFDYNKNISIIVFGIMALIAIVVEFIRFKKHSIKLLFNEIFGFLLRDHEFSNLTGATYLLTSSLLCIAIFPADIAFISISFLSIGDTVAALIGIRFGKRKIIFTKKSLEGSIACFVCCFIFSVIFLDNLDLTTYGIWVISLFGALAATIAESSKVYLDDNIKIPIFSALVMTIVYLVSY